MDPGAGVRKYVIAREVPGVLQKPGNRRRLTSIRSPREGRMEQRLQQKVPDRTEPLVGWKIWEVRSFLRPGSATALDYALVSPVQKDTWEPGKRFEAGERCYFEWSSSFVYVPRFGIAWPKVSAVPHASPNWNCRCGVYAFKEESGAIGWLGSTKDTIHEPTRDNADMVPPVCYAVGRVSLWGVIYEHEEVFRVQYAYPYDIALMGGTADIANNIRNRYQVDVRVPHKKK